MNNITATTKLEWALNMVEAMTYLHNFEKGVIVHGRSTVTLSLATTILV